MRSYRQSRFLILAMKLLQRMLKPFHLRLSRVIAGHKFFVDPSTDIGFELLVTGRFERDAIAQCANFIRVDGTVVDVGANIGVHAVHFAAFARLGTVICFEPARSTFVHLLRNVKHLPNVVPLNVALSDATGLQPFFVATDDAYSGLKDTKRAAILVREQVACFRADEFLPELTRNLRIDLVKIDVEGLEMQVLAGMKEFIVAHRPVIFCEIFGGLQSNCDPQATVQFCISLGYDAFVLNGAELTPAGVHDDRLYNYFFIPRK